MQESQRSPAATRRQVYFPMLAGALLTLAGYAGLLLGLPAPHASLPLLLGLLGLGLLAAASARLLRAQRDLGAAHAQSRRALAEQLRRTTLLTRLSIELRASLDTPALAHEALAAIIANTDAHRASILLIDAGGAVELACVMVAGELRPLGAARAGRLLAGGLAGWALRNGRNLVLADVAADERWEPLGDQPHAGSAMALLLRHGQATLGVLTITHPERSHFTSQDLLLFEGAAAQIGVALSAARQLREERRRRDQALGLLAISQFLTAQRTPSELAGELLAQSEALFAADHAAIYLAGRSTGGLRLLMARPAAPGEPAGLAELAELAWQAREARAAELPGGERAAVALPLAHNGVAIGVLALARRSRGPALFSAAGWSLLMVFGNVAAAALVNLRLIAQLQRRARDLEQQVHERTAQLAQSRDLLRIIFDQLPDGLVLLDDQQRVLTANQAFCERVLGRAPAELAGTRYPAIVAELRQRQALRIEPAPDGQRRWRAALRAEHGRARWYLVDRYAAHTGAGAGVIERWRDVTREEELHQRLLQHEQLTSMARLAASVVHEVGNPLQSVRSCLDLCREAPALAAEYLELADTELERMSGILNRLRDLYRPPQLVWEHVDLNKLVVVVRHLTARQFAAHGVDVTIELAPELPPLRAQADPLRQVLLNLLLNAQQAMPAGGTIGIATAAGRDQPGCYLRVSDSGAGIAPERLAQIFEPFASSKPQGLGLGLYISRRVVEQHGGTITIASALGAGTTITIWLPYREEITDGAETYATAG